MSTGQAEKMCGKFYPSRLNPGSCGRCAWPEADHTRNMQPYQLRVIEELKALAEKRYNLGLFQTNRTFATLSADEQERLARQFEIMKQYEAVLQERIDHFPGSELESLENAKS